MSSLMPQASGQPARLAWDSSLLLPYLPNSKVTDWKVALKQTMPANGVQLLLVLVDLSK